MLSRRPLPFLIVLCGLVSAVGFSTPARAYNILTLSMGGYWNNLADQYIGAREGYGAPHAIGERWYTMVSPSQLSHVNLLSYDVFLVQSGFTDDYVTHEATDALAALNANRTSIASFVRAGHGLVAWAEPMPDGLSHPWGWTPVDVRSRGISHENLVEVTDPNHPIMRGSTSERLSNWHSSWHGYFDSYDSRLGAVARTGDYGAGDPRSHRDLTLAGSYWSGGCGRMVFSMQDADYHAYQQAPFDDRAATLITHSLDWAAECPIEPVPEPATLSLLAVGLAGFALRLRRGRGDRGPSSSE